jgi:hypothetical protein
LREQVYLLLSCHIFPLFLTSFLSITPSYVADLLGYLRARPFKLFALFSLWVTAAYGAQITKESWGNRQGNERSSHIKCCQKKMVNSHGSVTQLQIPCGWYPWRIFRIRKCFHHVWMSQKAYVMHYLIIFTLMLWRIEPLLSNSRNIHACNNRSTGLCNPFLSIGSINTFPRKRIRAII